MNEIGPNQLLTLTETWMEQNIPPVPSISLGTPDLSIYEMVAAYSTFANKGVYTKPVMVTRIEDKLTVLYYINFLRKQEMF